MPKSTATSTTTSPSASSSTSAMQAFLDGNLSGNQIDYDGENDNAEEMSALSNALDDQSYHIVQHLIHELGESRTKEERIRQEFETFRQWMKKISVPDLIKDVEVVMDENARLIMELRNKSRDMDRMSSEVDKLRSENYDYKMKILAASKKAQEAQSSKNEKEKKDKAHKEEIGQLEGQVHELVMEIDDLQDTLEKISSENRKLTSEKYSVEKQLREAQIEHKKVEQQMTKLSASGQASTEGGYPEDVIQMQQEMEEELQDMQHMLEEAVKGKHDLKREVERLTQEILVLKAAQGPDNLSCSLGSSKNLSSSIGSSKHLDGDDDDSQQRKHVKSKTRDLKRIKELEKALQEMMDDNDQLEGMLEEKCKKVDRLNAKLKEMKENIDQLNEEKRQSQQIQQEQKDDILFLKEENEKQKARNRRCAAADEQKQYAAPLDTAEAIRLQEEQIQLQDEFHQFRATVKSDKAATDALVQQMSFDLESMRKLGEQVAEENRTVKARNETLMDLVSSCSCRSNSNKGEADNAGDEVPRQQQPLENGVPSNSSTGDASNELYSSNASARLMALIRDRFNNQDENDCDNDGVGRTNGNLSDGDERSEAQSSTGRWRGGGGGRARQQRNLRTNGNNPRGFFGRRQRNDGRQREGSIVEDGLAELNAVDAAFNGEKNQVSSNQSVNTTNRGFPRWGRNRVMANSIPARQQPKQHLLARRHSLDM